jgi:hypothetical protein
VEISATDCGSVKPTLWRGLGIVGLTAAALLLCAWTPTTLKIAEPGLVLELPAVVGKYEGGPEREMDTKEKQVFAEGVKLKRRFYLTPSNRRIMATLVMSGPAKKSLHEPTTCLPDQGWTIGNTEQISIKLEDGRLQPVSLMHIFREGQSIAGLRMRQRALYLYWYQGSHGLSTPSYNVSYARTYLDSIFRNLNHRWGQAAFFLPLAEHPAGMDDPIEEAAAQEELVEFVGKLGPHILAASVE